MPYRRNPVTSRQRAKGFTLIELLIAVLVVALGLLGHASLQAKSSRAAVQARYDQAANNAMSDLLQRLIALPNATLNDEFDVSNLNTGNDPAAAKDCEAEVCTRAEFADFEVRQWFLDAKSVLPNLRFSLAHTDNVVTLNMVWDAGLSGAGAADCNGNDHQCREVQLWLR